MNNLFYWIRSSEGFAGPYPSRRKAARTIYRAKSAAHFKKIGYGWW